jgi:hypothetical protein
MQAQSIICLNKDQIKIVLKNWFEVLELTNVKILKNEHNPEFSQENIKKYNLPHITKFADNYQLIQTENKDGIKHYFFIIEATKFDKLYLSAIVGYWYLISEDVLNSYKNTSHPIVFVCPAYVITESMHLHIPVNLLPCLYRFVSLCEIYPRLGSVETFGLAYDLKLLPKETKSVTGYDYAEILDTDVDVKIVNGLSGEVIRVKRVLFEGSPYSEYYYRRIINTNINIHGVNPNGICQSQK